MAQLSARRGRESLSDEIRDSILADYIAGGVVEAGARLPAEGELCDRYNASRVTVRAALRSLREAGYIDVRHGIGATVVPRPDVITHGIDRLVSLDRFARDAARKVETTDLEIDTVPAGAKLAQRTGIPVGTPTLSVSRTKLYDGKPVGWILDYVPEGVLPFDVIVSEFAGSVLEILQAHHEVSVAYSDCELVPVAVSGDLAQKLHVRRGTPALLMDEVTRTRGDQAVNWSQAWLLPEHLQFRVRRRQAFVSG
jgi:DNA-binding GntR family transcriptional regulator